MAKQQPYTVVETLPAGVEIRRYPAHTLISVDVSSDFGSAGSRGFGPLVRYISGGNAAGQNIAMTSPVTHAPQSDALHTISFVLPEGMAPDDAPIPVDGAVRIVDKPESVVGCASIPGCLAGARSGGKSSGPSKCPQPCGKIGQGRGVLRPI